MPIFGSGFPGGIRATYSKGRTPDSTAVTTDANTVKIRTGPFRVEYDCAPSGGGSTFAASEVVQNATSNPATAATEERSRHSVSNCRASLARLAPSAARTDSSAARSAVRAIKRFARLVHAISKTKTTAAISSSEASFTGPKSASRNETMLGRGLRLLPPPRSGKRSSRPPQRDAGFQPRNGHPAVVAWAESSRVPNDRFIRVTEPRRRDTNDRKRVSLDPDCGAQRLRVASKKLLPEPVTDQRIATSQNQPCCIHIVAGGESMSQYGLRAKNREEIPRCLRDVRPDHAASASKVRVDVLKGRSVCKILTLPPPIVKLPGSIVRRERNFAVW